MKLIIGLGNPTKKYENTRHNVGFMVISLLSSRLQASPFREFKRLRALITELWSDTPSKARGVITTLVRFAHSGCHSKLGTREKIILAKPQTFMNESGQAVRALASYYKIRPQDIWVIHDDIDLPLGKIRISQAASSAGHKGVESVIKEVGRKDFVRFRIGIRGVNSVREFFSNGVKEVFREKLGRLGRLFQATPRYVLEPFRKEEKPLIKKVILRTVEALGVALKEGVAKAMNEYN